jgi:hypothetical protein
MSAGGPFPGAFRHQHGDPQSLRERIDAQLRERIEEAVEMAGLSLMVERRKREQRPLPQEDNTRDREEFRAMAEDLLEHLHTAFLDALPTADRQAADAAAPDAGGARAQRLAVQVLLAKRLPDYWQRFETHRDEHARAQLGAASAEGGWLKRLFKGSG